MSNIVTIVSGLPRSGTSMMMKMLEAGGMDVVVDNVRAADEDNPKGYYEFEKVKTITSDASWLDDAQGKVFKMVSMLLKQLPLDKDYKVIFMKRKMEEILASQRQMLIRQGKSDDQVSDKDFGRLFEKHLQEIEKWLATQSNFDILYINYNHAIEHPLQNVNAVNQFLGNILNIEKMLEVVDKALYRQKK